MKEQTILQDTEKVAIPDELVSIIIEKLVSVMNERIANISPDDDPSADYGESWTTGSYESDDCLELDEPYDEYEIGYQYELTWRYRSWTEYWTDPVCYPSFDEMDSEAGEIWDITIFTPDGDEVEQGICKNIAKMVNDKIK